MNVTDIVQIALDEFLERVSSLELSEIYQKTSLRERGTVIVMMGTYKTLTAHINKFDY